MPGEFSVFIQLHVVVMGEHHASIGREFSQPPPGFLPDSLGVIGGEHRFWYGKGQSHEIPVVYADKGNMVLF